MPFKNIILCEQPIANTGTNWYDTIRDAILTCAQKLAEVSLIYRMEPKTKKWEKRRTKK